VGGSKVWSAAGDDAAFSVVVVSISVVAALSARAGELRNLWRWRTTAFRGIRRRGRLGTVNGTNVCSFEVDAWAGSFTGNIDAFGLKITACASGGDRYSLPATALTKGSVIIHN